jgi:hypothetical protein
VKTFRYKDKGGFREGNFNFKLMQGGLTLHRMWRIGDVKLGVYCVTKTDLYANVLTSSLGMAPRYRATQYEDLPSEIRAYIFAKLRQMKIAAAVVFQKYTLGRVPRLAWKSTFRVVRNRIQDRNHLNDWVDEVLRIYRDHEFRMASRGRIGGEEQPDESPYNRLRRSPPY